MKLEKRLILGYLYYFSTLTSISNCEENAQNNSKFIQNIRSTTSRSKIPKCCQNGEMASSRNHPEICIFSTENVILQSFEFKHSPLNCIRLEKMYNVGIKLDQNLLKSFTEVNNTEFCIDHISNEPNDLYLFTCGDNWPYEEFGLKPIETYILGIPFTISVLFLILTIVSHLLVKQPYDNIAYWMKLNIFLAFLSLNLCFLIGIFIIYDNREKCTPLFTTFIFITAICNYWVISTCTLMNISSLNSFWRLRSPVGRSSSYIKRKSIIYNLIGFGAAVLYVIVLFGHSMALWYSGLCLALINIFCFVGIFIFIIKYRIEVKMSRENQSSSTYAEFQQSLRTFVKLFLVTGIMWTGLVLENLAFSKNRFNPPWYSQLFRSVLCSQGLIFFVIFGWNKKAWIRFREIFQTETQRNISTRSQTSILSQSQDKQKKSNDAESEF